MNNSHQFWEIKVWLKTEEYYIIPMQTEQPVDYPHQEIRVVCATILAMKGYGIIRSVYAYPITYEDWLSKV